MKRILSIVVIIMMAANLMGAYRAEAKRRDNLYTLLEDQPKVRTYIQKIKDSSENASEILGPLEKALLNTLETRMTISFVMVNHKDEADIVIGCDIKDFSDNKGKLSVKAVFRVEKGPQKIIFKYASRFLKKRKVLWKETLRESIFKESMDSSSAKTELAYGLIDEFMKRCFSITSEIIG